MARMAAATLCLALSACGGPASTPSSATARSTKARLVDEAVQSRRAPRLTIQLRDYVGLVNLPRYQISLFGPDGLRKARIAGDEPVQFVDLPPGNYRVVLSNATHRMERGVQLRWGEDELVEFAFAPKLEN